jgi:vacuolar-type H+-ATPase subunit F/Vma7
MSRLRVVAIGQFPQITGLALAGVPVIEAESRDEAAARLDELVKQPDVGVVVAPQAVVRALSESTRRRLESQSTPVVLGLPNADWSETASPLSSEILDLLQRAIGYRVRLQ